MGDTWITDIRHFLDDRGEFPHGLPRPALNLATHLARIIEAVTQRSKATKPFPTNVQCRRRPLRKRCEGYIIAFLQNDSRIRWYCPFCHDNGFISGWQNTKWNSHL